MKDSQTKSPKEIISDVINKKASEELWTANYLLALPFTPQGFNIESILPAIFYILRWGHRRGRGNFQKTFSPSANQKATVDTVVDKLAEQQEFQGFNQTVEKAILGDLLLNFCVENRGHKLGRTEEIVRTYPTHYLTSWIDLPVKLSDLRRIPEMLVTILVDQSTGEDLNYQEMTNHCLGIVKNNLADNLLIDLFAQGMFIKDKVSNYTGDLFQEDTEVGIDQLLTIRIAQMCETPPSKASGGTDKITNQKPIATQAVTYFREYFTQFLLNYGKSIPRTSLLPMLESCFSLGISSIYLSTAMMLLDWEQTGKLPLTEQQKSWGLFVDCSNGNYRELRQVSEVVMDECVRRFEKIPIILMTMRVLDYYSENKSFVKKDFSLPQQPLATDWLDFLGSILQDEYEYAYRILEDIEEDCSQLEEEFKEVNPSVADILGDDQISAAVRLAEAIVMLMGDKNQGQRFREVLDFALMLNSLNGLGEKRRRIHSKNGQRQTSEARSIILTNTMLDFLVHCHLNSTETRKHLSFLQFIEILKNRYGLYIDQAPPGISVSSKLLLDNKKLLERRLRDLGLLVGVNDAESMKRIKPRF